LVTTTTDADEVRPESTDVQVKENVKVDATGSAFGAIDRYITDVLVSTLEGGTKDTAAKSMLGSLMDHNALQSDSVETNPCRTSLLLTITLPDCELVTVTIGASSDSTEIDTWPLAVREDSAMTRFKTEVEFSLALGAVDVNMDVFVAEKVNRQSLEYPGLIVQHSHSYVRPTLPRLAWSPS
jgi:hypothetical protein